jgi:2-methylcitrate dehydratase PrpD
MRAAFLAQKGVKGPAAILEGERGFLHAYSGESLPDEITRDLGKRYRVSLIELKAYCCCGTSGTTLDAVSILKKKHPFSPVDVEEIIVRTNPLTFRMTGSVVEPEDVTGAQFSGSFGVALRLIKGGNSFREYVEENLRDPGVLALARKTRLVLDEQLGKLPCSDNPAAVLIRLKNGTVLEETVPAGRGSILNPMEKEEVNRKFREYASAVLSRQKIEAVIETVDALDRLDHFEKLTQLLVNR